MIFRGVFPLAAFLALGACANAFSPAPAERQTAATPPPARPAPAIARPTSRATTVPDPELSSLIGQGTAQIDARIGAPDLVRSEGDGELRIYRNAACVLHVFAYSRGGIRQATHVEARTAEGQIVGADADACLAQFMKG